MHKKVFRLIRQELGLEEQELFKIVEYDQFIVFKFEDDCLMYKENENEFIAADLDIVEDIIYEYVTIKKIKND